MKTNNINTKLVAQVLSGVAAISWISDRFIFDNVANELLKLVISLFFAVVVYSIMLVSNKLVRNVTNWQYTMIFFVMSVMSVLLILKSVI